MDAVLGVSMTPTAVGLVLVDGPNGSGATAKSHAFDVRYGPIKTAQQTLDAVRRTAAQASARGLRLHSVGVTWSEDADAEAALLMKSLDDAGFDDVASVRLPDATEALARGMAAVTGYDTTAVCVIEPDIVVAVIVHTATGAVQKAVNHAIDSDESLIGWLRTMFARADWQPGALVLVGSAGGFDSVAPHLDDALGVPVFAPDEAKLALARGAALASSRTGGGSAAGEFAAAGTRIGAAPTGGRRNLLSAGATTLLIAGVLTFVVSVAVAIGLEFAPHRDATPAKPVAAAAEVPRAPARPAVVRPPVVLPPAPAAAPAPVPEAPPVLDAAPAEGLPAPEGGNLPDVLMDDPSQFGVPDALPIPPPIFDAPPRLPGPPQGFEIGEPTPPKKPGILDRIRNRLDRIGEGG